MIKILLFVLAVFSLACHAESHVQKDNEILLRPNEQGLFFFKNNDQPYTGQIITRYANGEEFEEKTYIKGVLRKYFSWTKNGQKHMVKTFADNGNLIDFIIWHSNGQKAYEEFYPDALKHGVIATWNPQGQILTETHYADGKANGLQTEWYDNDQKSREEKRIDGVQSGPVLRWQKDGTPIP
jgi:antitoxin component YwqK of YwqJK toxin-antitoxin module